MNHSPAPWIPARDGRGELALFDEQDRHLFLSDCETPLHIRTRVANVRLAAMAPRLLDALSYLLEQTVDQDLAHGIALTEGEEDARQQALAIFSELEAPIDLDAEADIIADDEGEHELCQDCDEKVSEDDPYFATPCGTFCEDCMAKHTKQCGICADEFAEKFDAEDDEDIECTTCTDDSCAWCQAEQAARNSTA